MSAFLPTSMFAELAQPSDVEVERRLISAILQCPAELLGLAMNRFKPDLFTVPALVSMALLIKEDVARGLKPDYNLLVQRLNDDSKSAILSEMRGTANPAQVLDYLTRCEERLSARAVQSLAFQLVRSLSTGEQLDEALALFQKGVSGSTGSGVDFMSAGDVAVAHYDKLMLSLNDPERNRPVMTGIRSLDLAIAGMHDELVLIAAANSVGKSAMLTTIANYNLDHLLPHEYLYLVSLEMTKASLVDRIVSARNRMNSVLFRTPSSLSKSQWNDLFTASDFLGEKLFLTYHKYALPEHIWSNVLAQRAAGKQCRAVFIDYLQLMATARVRKMKMRDDELRHAVASTLTELTDMAKELECPVIVAAQVNRDPERLRPDRPVPTMFNIAESANAEQACDIGLLLYRHHRFHPQSACHTEAEIHLGKMRNGGGIGVLPATYTGEYALFSDRKANCECPHCQAAGRKALVIAPSAQPNLRGMK